MNEKPLERLNYFNGQRLQAADFKLEQDYHMRVRRWLNRSLYTPGIASGLQVYKIPGAPKVKVMPGLAIDHLGREIILLEEQDFDVKGQGSGNGPCKGPYLTIRYQEEVIEQQDECCAVAGDPANKAPWGGPARILADPVLELNAHLPHESSGRIALACLTLGAGCVVERVDPGVRRNVGEASAAKVRQYALEGEREVAAIPAQGAGDPILVKGTVLFHIRGRQPNSVTLYLKATEFSALHYTELAAHAHTLSVSGSSGESNPELNTTKTLHRHDHGGLSATANANTPYSHSLKARRGYIGDHPADQPGDPGLAGFLLIERNWPVFVVAPGYMPMTDDDPSRDILRNVNGLISSSDHTHIISMNGSTEDKGLDLKHTHSIPGASSMAGAQDATQPSKIARTGKPLSFFYDLRIKIDGNDQTNDIRDQIANTAPSAESPSWSVLGNGTSSHPLADKDKAATAVKLDFLPGVTLDEGEHSIEFSVGLIPPNSVANGGCVQFNLYVE